MSESESKAVGMLVPCVAGVSVKLRRIFSKHSIPVHFKPTNTLRKKLVHPKDKTHVVYAVQRSEECPDLYIEETKQPLHKRMAQHRRATSSGQDSAVHLHLKDKGHSLEDNNVQILACWEDRWFERGVKEAIYVKLERPSLSRSGGLRYHLSSVYNSVLRSLPRKMKPHSHLTTKDLNKPYCVRGSTNDSHNEGRSNKPPAETETQVLMAPLGYQYLELPTGQSELKKPLG